MWFSCSPESFINNNCRICMLEYSQASPMNKAYDSRNQIAAFTRSDLTARWYHTYLYIHTCDFVFTNVYSPRTQPLKYHINSFQSPRDQFQQLFRYVLLSIVKWFHSTVGHMITKLKCKGRFFVEQLIN